MNQESIGSRNQLDVGVSHKKFFRTDRMAQIDFFNFWVINSKINFKKIPTGNNLFPYGNLKGIWVVSSADLY